MRDIFRLLGIRNVDDGSSVVLFLSGQRIELRAAVMADVCKPPVALVVKRRLIRAASLQVVIADEFHVAFLHLLLSEGSNTDQRENSYGKPPVSDVLTDGL